MGDFCSFSFMGEEVAKFWKENMIPREAKRELYEIVIPTVVYGSETWSLSAQETRKKYLR